jgi:hypothetical protein
MNINEDASNGREERLIAGIEMQRKTNLRVIDYMEVTFHEDRDQQRLLQRTFVVWGR